jgi:hypothetical protein
VAAAEIETEGSGKAWTCRCWKTAVLVLRKSNRCWSWHNGHRRSSRDAAIPGCYLVARLRKKAAEPACLIGTLEMMKSLGRIVVWARQSHRCRPGICPFDLVHRGWTLQCGAAQNLLGIPLAEHQSHALEGDSRWSSHRMNLDLSPEHHPEKDAGISVGMWVPESRKVCCRCSLPANPGWVVVSARVPTKESG